MGSFPGINWWPGNLPRHESLTSFLARFCMLNRRTLKQAQQYLGLKPHLLPTDDDVERVAAILNEDPSIVRTVLMPSLPFTNFGRYALPRNKLHEHSIKYCEKCAALGYHSALHEVECLQKCPFHQEELVVLYTGKPSESKTKQHMAAIQEIMRQRCKTWPRVDGSVCAVDEKGLFNQLSEWAASASNSAIKFSQGQIWYFGEDDFSREPITLEQAVGVLQTITPMPEALKPLFVDVSELWHLTTREFPLITKIALAKLTPKIPFGCLLDFYKMVSGYSSHPPEYITHCKKAQATFKARHGSNCHCCWGQMKLGWDVYHWIQVDPNGWPHWTLLCPYDVAVQELELSCGCINTVLSDRMAEKATIRFIKWSQIMHDAQLIEYTPTAIVSESGDLFIFPQVWPCCEWKNSSPLTGLLNAIVELEVVLIFNELKTWLDDIDKGLTPYTRRDLTGCIRLCETPKGLLLVSWSHKPRPDSTSENGYFQK